MLRRAVTSLRLRAADARDAVAGRRPPLIPPRRLNFVGNSDFAATGEEFLGHFEHLAGLAPGDRVLDVGCGVGRMARGLTRVLAPPTGSYDGFDVSAEGIAWCRRHYRDTAAPFRFTHVDLHHPEYNPGGAGDADTFRFPYPDRAFDLVIATSVFTHLLDGGAERYVAEAARVLAPGGRLFCTWFLLDPERPPEPSGAMIAFQPFAGAAAAQVADPRAPEMAVAYPIGWLRERLAGAGLTVREPPHQGAWSGRPGASSQDIVIADRL